MSADLYPIALDLQGKSVLVAGGGHLAARKLPELLRCGAHVTVVAPSLHPTVERLLPKLKWLARAFEPGDEIGQSLVFTLTDSSEANAEIGRLCRSRGIWCNRADAASEGDFQVPGVIRRGPVTLTASTGGTVPGLTRLLKRHLDTLFGAELPLLAEVLGEWRQRARERGENWRVLFEALPYEALLTAAKQGRTSLALAVEKALSQGDKTPPQAAPASDPSHGPGSHFVSPTGARPVAHTPANTHPVILLGAGPGHPGLLTRLGVEALQQAEALLHDRLIPPEILDLAPEACLRIPVEKRGHHESVRQEHINEKLVEQALTGKRVVRLKGGDPFIFGRGYEEILALEAAGLAWSVLPGVSSATAAPAWAGIPLTHRGMARSFAVMTGTAYDAPDPEIPRADTVVILMGLQRLPAILAAFLKRGDRADTPAAAIEKGTRGDQRVCVGTLASLAEKTARLGFDSPTLVIIGAVASLAKPTAE